LNECDNETNHRRRECKKRVGGKKKKCITGEEVGDGGKSEGGVGGNGNWDVERGGAIGSRVGCQEHAQVKRHGVEKE